MPETESPLLPTTVVPRHYDLVLSPDLVTATFDGTARIELEIRTATDEITCHAADLDVRDATLVLGDGRTLPGAITLDPAREEVTFRFAARVPAGSATLQVGFRGVLGDKLRGFYRSTWLDDDGGRHTIAVTQFEATDARRAFTCWDEPGRKATFQVTLEVAEDLVAVSNTPEVDRTPLGDGRVSVRFAPTMPMSTYLVAFVVGHLELSPVTEVDGIPIRIVHRPGQGELAHYAARIAADSLHWLAQYYGIAYPGAKLDLVAVPDFAFGAMENLGCVVFRENLLLIDPGSSTQAELQAVVDVIAHELAHMWFGDLVTMAWWNGIWLNEAFATFMEMKCTDALFPEWKRFSHFGRERSEALDIDALASTRPIEFPVVTPADADAMFDVLTYQKGAAVVRMLEQYLGEDAFRDGIGRYLQTHQYANTETSDLWDSLEAETGEPVRALMDTWIFQGGFPLVRAAADDGAGAVGAPPRQVRLTQQPFRYLDADGLDPEVGDPAPPPTWQVPVVLRSGTGSGARVERVLLGPEPVSVPVTGLPVVVNAGGHGFYRVAPDDSLSGALLEGLGGLHELERYTLLDDTWGVILRGDRPATDVTTLVARLAQVGEDDLSVWQLAAQVLDDLGRIVDDRGAWDVWVRGVLAPLDAALGPAPAPADDERRRALRGLVLGLLATAGEADARARAEDLLRHAITRPASVDPGLAAGALRAVSANADSTWFDAIIDGYRKGRTPQESLRSLYALGAVRDEQLFERYLDFVLGDEVRTQNVAFALRGALGNDRNGALAWRRIRAHWEGLVDRIPEGNFSRMIGGVERFTSEALAADVEEFLAGHPLPHADRAIAQHLERMRVSVALRRREGGALDAWLTQRAADAR